MDAAGAAAGTVNIGKTYGALLFGAAMAFGLSGIVLTQCLVYFKQYPEDSYKTKAMVLACWFLDLAHSAFVMLTIYEYFITHFGEASRIDYIPWPLAISVVFTALQTLLVHCFFAVKIFRSSQNNWFITGPIVFLAIARLASASITTINMLRLHRFSSFMVPFPRTMFTTGLSLTAAVDVLITGWLCYFLVEIRTRISPCSTMMIRMVDTLTLYTFENGSLTCLAAIASLICWLVMPHNLIFMGLHFVIAKLYANSFLASLNMRRQLLQIHGGLDAPQTGGDTAYYAKGGGANRPVESTLRIQNSVSKPGDLYADDIHMQRRHPSTPSHVNSKVNCPNGLGLGGNEVRGGEAVIQFRPASSYYWNVITRDTKPVV